MNGLQKATLLITLGVVGFFGWVFLHDPTPSQPTSNQSSAVPTDAPLSMATVLAGTQQEQVNTVVSQPQTTIRPLGVYIPLEDACYRDDVIGVGSNIDIFWRVWFPRFSVLLATLIAVYLIWLGAQMYEHTTTLNNTYAILQENHTHELELQKIRATMPVERPINYTVNKNAPQTNSKQTDNVIPLDEELVFYFAENAPARGLAVRDWEKIVGFDRQTISTIMTWLDEKAFLIDPPTPGKAASWLNGRIPAPETIVNRLGLNEDRFNAWLETYLEE